MIQVKYRPGPVPQAFAWDRELTNLKVKQFVSSARPGLGPYTLGWGKGLAQNGERHFLLYPAVCKIGIQAAVPQ